MCRHRFDDLEQMVRELGLDNDLLATIQDASQGNGDSLQPALNHPLNQL
jgi:hypothetical protein